MSQLLQVQFLLLPQYTPPLVHKYRLILLRFGRSDNFVFSRPLRP